LSELIVTAALAVAVALLLLGCVGGLLPRLFSGAAVAAACLVGTLTGLAALVFGTETTTAALPLGPPGLPLLVTLDAISAPFLIVVMLCGAGTAALAMAAPRDSHADPASPAVALAGVALVLLAADAVLVVIGLALVGAGLWRLAPTGPSASLAPPRSAGPWLAALLVLIALALGGPPPAFAAIAATPMAAWREAALALLALAAALFLLVPAPPRHGLDAGIRAGALIPAGLYLLIRLLIDLPGMSLQPWTTELLLLAGAAIALVNGWRGAAHPTMPGAIHALIRGYAGTAVMAFGLAMQARSADLPDAEAFALAAALLLTLGTALTGTLGCLAGAALTEGAGTAEVARLGGLIQTMPFAAYALAAALLALSALPSGLGFAGIWLLFQALLAAPRPGGLGPQVVLLVASLAAAVSIALAAATCLRLAGVALLGRPRSARASGATDIVWWQRLVLLVFAALALLVGLLPGATLRALAEPAITRLAGTSLSRKIGLLSMAGAGPGSSYAAIPLLALVLLATIGAIVLTRRYRAGARLSTAWNEGQILTPNLPFGDPMAQSAGTGFRPSLPASIKLPALSWTLSRRPLAAWWQRATTARTGLWAVLVGAGAMLVLLSLFIDQGSP